MIKPKTCSVCPVVKIDKNKLYCACERKLKAEIKDLNGQELMWQNCPLEWEKEKKNEKF